MKKFTFILFSTIFIWQLSYAQTYFEDGFEGDFPAEWTLTTTDSNSTWELTYYPTHSGSKSLYCEYGSASQNEILMSPIIDLSSSSTPRLSFWFYTSNYNAITKDYFDFSFEVTTDGGTTTTVIWSDDENSSFGSYEWTEVNIDLSAYASKPNVQLIIKYVGSGMGSVAIDDLKVDETPSCIEPSDLILTSVGATSATLSWTAGASETSWEIEYGEAGFTTGSGTVVSADSNPYTLSSLTEETNYEAYVRAVCSGEEKSIWVGPVKFTPANLPECPTIISPIDGATDIPIGLMNFEWIAATTGGQAKGYKLYFGTTPDDVSSYMGIYTSTSVELEVNDYNSIIYWKVVPTNDAGIADCSVSSFTTEAYIPPTCTHGEFFDGDSMPEGWTSTIDSGDCDFSFGKDMPSYSGSNFTTNAIIFDDSACGVSAPPSSLILTSPVYNIPTTANEISFSYDVAFQGMYGGDETLNVKIFNGTEWVELVSYSDTFNEIKSETFDIKPYANDKLQIKFEYSDGDGWSYGFGVDNFCIKVEDSASNEEAKIEGFTMYPNPTKDVLNINTKNNIDNIYIFNIIGQKVFETTPKNNNANLELSHLNPGTYILKIKTNGQLGSYRFIKN